VQVRGHGKAGRGKAAPGPKFEKVRFAIRYRQPIDERVDIEPEGEKLQRSRNQAEMLLHSGLDRGFWQ
jgi:hypothetical protein